MISTHFNFFLRLCWSCDCLGLDWGLGWGLMGAWLGLVWWLGFGLAWEFDWGLGCHFAWEFDWDFDCGLGWRLDWGLIGDWLWA